MLEDSRLRMFTVLAEEGNFTRAARRLGISQPAVSQSISELERSLGVKLFTRTRTAAVLTGEGEMFRSYATEILKWYEAADTLFGLEGRATVNRPVGVSCPAMAAEAILPALLSDLVNVTSDAFTVHVIPDEGADQAEDDITLFTLPRKDTLDFETGATLCGSLSAAAGAAAKDPDTGSAQLAVWKPYEKMLPAHALARVHFSSDSPAAAIRLTARVPGMVCLVPYICLKDSGLHIAPEPLPHLQTDLHIRFGRRFAPAALTGVLKRKLSTIIQ